MNALLNYLARNNHPMFAEVWGALNLLNGRLEHTPLRVRVQGFGEVLVQANGQTLHTADNVEDAALWVQHCCLLHSVVPVAGGRSVAHRLLRLHRLLDDHHNVQALTSEEAQLGHSGNALTVTLEDGRFYSAPEWDEDGACTVLVQVP